MRHGRMLLAWALVLPAMLVGGSLRAGPSANPTPAGALEFTPGDLSAVENSMREALATLADLEGLASGGTDVELAQCVRAQLELGREAMEVGTGHILVAGDSGSAAGDRNFGFAAAEASRDQLSSLVDAAEECGGSVAPEGEEDGTATSVDETQYVGMLDPTVQGGGGFGVPPSTDDSPGGSPGGPVIASPSR